MAKGNQLVICEHCGYRFYSEQAKQQLITHQENCYQYQSEQAEKAKLLASPPVEPATIPDEPEVHLPISVKKRRAE